MQQNLAVWRLEKEAGAGEAHEQIGSRRGFILAVSDFRVGLLRKLIGRADQLDSRCGLLSGP